MVLFCSVQGRSNISEPVDEILQRDHLNKGYVTMHNNFFPINRTEKTINTFEPVVAPFITRSKVIMYIESEIIH